MKYESYHYLWMPRPDKAIPVEFLSFYEKKGWISQIKMNGTANVLAVAPDRSIVAMSRHNDTHKLWTPNEETSADFAKLPGKGWYVFTTELMHSKVPGIRNVNYVHDILVDNGNYLVGETFSQRQARLFKILLNGRKSKSREVLSHWEVSPTLWVAKSFAGGHRDIYDRLDRPEHEGIVLKNPDAPLALCSRATDNSNWQAKCRKTHKNFSF